MNTDIDWRDELDSSFGTGPDRPPADYLPAGRAALRRRRTATVAATIATVAVIGAIGWAVAPDDGSRRGSSDIASDPAVPHEDDTSDGSDRDDGQPRPDARAGTDKPQFLGEPATYDTDGAVVMAPGWVATETIPNPMGYDSAGWTSVGLRAVRGDEERFVMAAFQGDGTSVFSRPAAGSLAAWLEGAVASQRTLDAANGEKRKPRLVTADMQSVVMTPRGEFHVFGGVRIVDSRTGSALPGPLRALGDVVVAAQVTAADGSTEWALGWLADGEPDEVISTAEFADLDAFVESAAELHASGQGLR